MVELPEDLRATLKHQRQEHVLAWWDRLNEAERKHLLRELRHIPLEQLQALYALRDQKDALPARERIEHLPHPHIDASQRQTFRALGERALSQGEVAFLVV